MAHERDASGRGEAQFAAAAVNAGDATQHVADLTLVRGAQSGTDAAFAAIVDRYHARIYALVYRICGPREAEDITQEVFLRAMVRMQEFRPRNEASLRTWLYRIAMNLSINELRSMQRRRRLEGPSLDAPVHVGHGSVKVAVADISAAPHVLAERAETRRLVHAMIRQLPPKYQQVLALVDLEGMEYEQAAAVIGCRTGTVKSRLSRARQAFAVKMKACMALPAAK